MCGVPPRATQGGEGEAGGADGAFVDYVAGIWFDESRAFSGEEEGEGEAVFGGAGWGEVFGFCEDVTASDGGEG